MHVTSPGHVLLLNCTFYNNEGGSITVDEGGNVVAKHCTFRDENGGSMAWDTLSTLDCQYSTFTNINHPAIEIGNGGSVSLLGCVNSFTSGFCIEGPKRSKFHMEDCKTVNCKTGLFVVGGKTDIIVSNSDFSCEKDPLHVHFDVIGNIDMVNSTFVCISKPSGRLCDQIGPQVPNNHRWRRYNTANSAIIHNG